MNVLKNKLNHKNITPAQYYTKIRDLWQKYLVLTYSSFFLSLTLYHGKLIFLVLEKKKRRDDIRNVLHYIKIIFVSCFSIFREKVCCTIFFKITQRSRLLAWLFWIKGAFILFLCEIKPYTPQFKNGK